MSQDLYSQSVIQALANQRTATADQLAHVQGLLAVANARVGELEEELKQLRAEKPSEPVVIG